MQATPGGFHAGVHGVEPDGDFGEFDGGLVEVDAVAVVQGNVGLDFLQFDFVLVEADVLAAFGLTTFAQGAENPYLGRWALTLQGDRAGWLGVEEEDGGLASSVLWGGGSVLPTA